MYVIVYVAPGSYPETEDQPVVYIDLDLAKKALAMERRHIPCAKLYELKEVQ